MPTVLDDALKDYTSFIESMMDKTIYDFIRKQIKDVFTGMIVLVLSYYLAWITGLYSIDLMIYIISNHRYTLFGYMLENTYLCIVMFLVSLILAQFIRPWAKSEEKETSQPPNKAMVNLQYLQGFLERFISFRGLGRAWQYSKTTWGRILINFIENLVALPVLISSEKLFIFDIFQTPYLKNKEFQNEHKTKSNKKSVNVSQTMVKDYPADVLEIILREDTIENYRLEPFREDCKKPQRVEEPLLRKACWYKVYRKKNRWMRIGYAMILVVVRRKFPKNDVRECMKALGARLRGNKRYCYEILKS